MIVSNSAFNAPDRPRLYWPLWGAQAARGDVRWGGRGRGLAWVPPWAGPGRSGRLSTRSGASQPRTPIDLILTEQTNFNFWYTVVNWFSMYRAGRLVIRMVLKKRICPSRMVEHPKSKSTQPRYSTTIVTLYNRVNDLTPRRAFKFNIKLTEPAGAGGLLPRSLLLLVLLDDPLSLAPLVGVLRPRVHVPEEAAAPCQSGKWRSS